MLFKITSCSNIHVRKISLSAYFKAILHYFGFNWLIDEDNRPN